MAGPINLPEGFVLDSQAAHDTLPQGFVLDNGQSSTNNISNELTSELARTGRAVAGGLGGIADTGYAAVAPIYQGLRALAKQTDLGAYLPSPQDTQKYAPSTALTSLYDQVTNNAGMPQNKLQNIVQKSGQFLTSGLGAGLASNANAITDAGREALQMMAAPATTSGALSFAGAGAGSEAAKQQFPDSAIAPIVGGLIGGVAPAIPQGLGLGKQIIQEGLAKGAASVLPNVSDEIAPIAQKALEYNIPISRTQMSESEPAKTLASAAGKIPLSGATDFASQQQNAFNREVLSTIGANSEKVTPEIIANSYKNISNSFNDALKGQNVKVTPDAVSRLADIKLSAQEFLSPDAYAIVQKQIDKLEGLFSPQKSVSELLGVRNNEATIPGEKLGSMRSDLSGMSKGQGNEKLYLAQLKNLVQDVSVAGAPERQAQLQDAIQKFRNYQIIKPLLNKAVTGDISPATLLGRVASNYSNFAQGGGGKLGDLARIGKAFIQNKVPDSGTAQRLMAYKALEGAGALAAGGYAGGLPGAAAAIGVPIAAARGFNAINNSQRLAKNTLGLPSPINIPSSINNLPPGVALQALLQTQQK